MDADQSPKILITRLSHIGDCVLTLPVLTNLRHNFRNSFIVWAVEAPAAQFLSMHPCLDEVVVIPKSWLSRPKTWPSISSQLRRFQFDVSIDPQGITKSAALAWISGAKRRIGLRGQWGREFSPWLNNELLSPESTHIVDRSLELLTAFGIERDRLAASKFGLPICGKSLLAMRSQVSFLQTQQPFVLINPGGSWASKRWEMQRYGIVAKYLLDQHSLRSVIVWAGPNELEMARAIHVAAPDASTIAPPTNLRELAAISSQAMFFIGGDTGPMHIATAMGTPCIGMYGTTRPEDSGAYGDQNIAIQKWYQSGSCRQRRTADNDAMRDISVADIFNACDQMIDRLSRKQGQAAA